MDVESQINTYAEKAKIHLKVFLKHFQQLFLAERLSTDSLFRSIPVETLQKHSVKEVLIVQLAADDPYSFSFVKHRIL